ncbi:MAG: cytochrome c biogenesis protein CcsA [Planctomycetota bacterium]|jgi:ABC-type transport system involved in cytochrome c biogenesis permease subunit
MEYAAIEQGMVTALLVVHLLALLLWVAGLAARSRTPGTAAVVVLVVALLLNTLVLGARWYEAGRAPFKTLYETFLLISWCVALMTLSLVWLHRLRLLIPFCAGACIAALGWARIRPETDIVSLPPALQSPWFVPHVVTYFMAYAALFASFALATAALAKPDAGFEDHAHGTAKFGFLALTLGLVMGAFWGQSAWADYWGWDAKENWALVTFLAYLVYLHLRYVKGWKGRRSMVACVLCFVAVVFTYLGMNLLPTASKSIHVYQ